MRSYAQNNEDLRLWNVFKDVRGSHTYIDIGAGHPTDFNVTKIFYDAGWSGMNIEPGPNYEALLAERPRDRNIKCAISNVFGIRKFYVSPIHPDLSSLEGEGKSIMVDTLPLRYLQRWVNTPAFLKIDVEGHEASVLQSADWVKKKPLVVVVEAIDAITLEPNHEGWEPILLDAGYTFAYFDGINRFYGRHPKTVSRLHIDLPTLPQYPRS